MASAPSNDSLLLEGNAQISSSKPEISPSLAHTNAGTSKHSNSHLEHRHHNKAQSVTRVKPLNQIVAPMKNSHVPEMGSSYTSFKDKFKTLSPIHINDDYYRESYYNVLEQGGNFKRKQGMFSDFSVKNKVTIEQMKHDRSPKRDHNRYMSKPVLFTALDTKNKLSESVAISHAQILANRPTKFLDTQDHVDEIVVETTKSKRIDGLSFSSPRTNKSREPSVHVNLPQINSVKNSKNSTMISPYRLKGSVRSYSPEKSQDISVRTPTLELNNPDFNNMNANESKMLSSMSGKSMSKFLGENYSILDSVKRSQSDKVPMSMEASKLEKQQLPRYKTKKLTDTIFKKFYENSKLDGEKYLERTTDSVYKINSSIALSKLENEKSLVRKNPLNPIAYTPKTGNKAYKEPTTKEQITKFDENLLGWAKSIPNFGKQRWTYDPHWKFGLI